MFLIISKTLEVPNLSYQINVLKISYKRSFTSVKRVKMTKECQIITFILYIVRIIVRENILRIIELKKEKEMYIIKRYEEVTICP